MTNPAPNLPPQPPELAALYFALAGLGPDTGEFAGRLTLRGPDGAFVGEVRLTPADIEALTLAATAVGDAAHCTEENSRPEGESHEEEFARLQAHLGREREMRAAEVRIDPDLENDFEQYCIGLPVESLMAMNPADAVAEFDLITSDEDDV